VAKEYGSEELASRTFIISIAAVLAFIGVVFGFILL
jgi:hypothetical protein